MPLSILVRNGGPTSAGGSGEAPRLTFDGDRIVLGRGTFADVRLPDPSVSARHATIRAVDGDYQLFDEGSTNGTFVGGVRLAMQTPRSLRSGDVIRLGRVWVEVRTEPAPLTQDLPLATRDLAFRLVEDAMRALGDNTAPTVSVVEGPDLGLSVRLADEGHVYVVGRGETCELSLHDPDASRDHVQLVRRGSSVLAQDLGGKNRAALGESWLPTDRAVAWRRPAMLRVGRTVLALTEPVAEALAELECSDDEALPEGGAPPPPPPTTDEGPPADADAHDVGAPIIDAPPSKARAHSRDGSGWSATDVAVAGAAMVVIGLSAAGLYWLLRS
jgi:pSer/pThr/pTyr-binding forkhead associated (FHA) protein